MAEIATDYWLNDLGEDKFKIWFRKSYLCDLWKNWYSCASGTPGVVTNQNPQESKHCTFKQCVCKGSLNKSTQKC